MDGRWRTVLGLDPGLRRTGWGMVQFDGSRLRHVANGTVVTTDAGTLADRLNQLFSGLVRVVEETKPDEAAVEETFLNSNPGTTLRLGHARGVVLLAPAYCGLPVAEYPAKTIKKALTGTGGAGKPQVEAMVRRVLPGVEIASADAADALAVAICHANHSGTLSRWSPAAIGASR